jgi:aspartate kinase
MEQMGLVVMKFGGAALSSASGIRNVASIISRMSADSPLLIVVSAMGKTTNALERLAQLAARGSEVEALAQQRYIETYHTGIAKELFGESSSGVLDSLQPYFDQIQRAIAGVLLLGEFPVRIYDRIMAFGELLSSVLLHAWLAHEQLATTWLDARLLLATDSAFGHAEVAWQRTAEQVAARVPALFEPGQIALTQGYIASNAEGRTTTLGREGSDYTAAVLANLLDAREVVIWKDVPAVMSADPRIHPDRAEPLPRLSYEQAVRMTFFGATVLHPKTIKPLQNKSIPLRVRCFLDPSLPGTLVSSEASERAPRLCIQKPKQVLLTLTTRDLAFLEGERLAELFQLATRAALPISFFQASAISLHICADDIAEPLADFLAIAADLYHLTHRTGITLTTLSLPSSGDEPFIAHLQPILRQSNGETLHIVHPTTSP